MRGSMFVTLAGLTLLFPTTSLWSADEEDEDYPPGLEARYTSRDQTIEQIDRDVQFTWGTGSPSALLPQGPFEAAWSGQVLVRAPGMYRLHLYLQGDASVSINGQVVVAGQRETAGWLHGQPVRLNFGEQPIEVRFRKTQTAASVRLFWSSDSFRLEPVPSQVLFHEQSRPERRQHERGSRLYTSLRCNRCHQRAGEIAAPAAPALTHASTGLRQDWLAAWLTSSDGRRPPHTRMPDFGFTQNESAAIAAFLHSQSSVTPTKPEPARIASPVPEADAAQQRSAGRLLFVTVGCPACHRHDDIGGKDTRTGHAAIIDDPTRLDGGDLTRVGLKRSSAWLQTWLVKPEQLIPDHRMPVFPLTDEERQRLSAFLAGEGQSPATPAASSEETLVAKGKALVERARCAACHAVPSIRPDAAAPVALPAFDQERWLHSCAVAAPDRQHARPGYHLAPDDQAALRAFVQSLPAALTPESAYVRGASLLRQKNCLACHERDGLPGIVPLAGELAGQVPELTGQSESLIPPDLTAVGDKLSDQALAEAIAGAPRTPRLPWLKIRMPRFQHTAAEKDALLAYLIDHDRIPEYDSRDIAAVSPVASPKPAAELPARSGATADIDQVAVLRSGHALIGAQGFSCIACHRLGTYEPPNVALGTRGSDLKLLGSRMRRAYFLRWTRSPLRIIPGMEMPSYDRPAKGILDGDIDRQLAALWDALNDPGLSPALSIAGVEQDWTVAADAPARIVRDVFRVAETPKPVYLPRAFAVGLNNGHNLLFDLETLSLQHWWPGDFARQRTMGKSWFWEASSVLPHAARPRSPDLVLRPLQDSSAAARMSEPDAGVYGRLLGYGQQADGVRLQYTLSFQTGAARTVVSVSESWLPLHAPAKKMSSGWRRQIDVSGVPTGHAVYARRHFAAGNPGLETPVPDNEQTRWQPLTVMMPPSAPQSETDGKRLTVTSIDIEASLLQQAGAGHARGEFQYESELPVVKSPASTVAPRPVAVAGITSVPGYDGTRLPLDGSIMPTALTWTTAGKLAFCSLKGHVYIADDSDGDRIPDRLSLFEEGLSAPYGIIAAGADLIVAHKPELLRLRDTDGDGRADVREVLATGWGYSDNYHDWTFGIVRDSRGNLYVGLGSDYADPKRPRETTRWRGKVLRIDPGGKVTPVGHAFRYPTGLAINADDQIFVTDNQGVANTFNELNHLVEGSHYGVPALAEEPHAGAPRNPAIQIPHPWTRSVNGVFFLPVSASAAGTAPDPFAGHGIGCEYDSRFLVRFTLQRLGDTYQGAVYPFSVPGTKDAPDNLLGTLCGGVSPQGDLYIGCIHDSGWLGGQNVGEIIRLTRNAHLPAGIREIRALPGGFRVDFTAPVQADSAALPGSYSISGYTRKWQGAYATPDSGRHQVEVRQVRVASDRRSVVLEVDRLQPHYIYEVTCGNIGTDPKTPLWPATGHYTMNAVPAQE